MCKISDIIRTPLLVVAILVYAMAFMPIILQHPLALQLQITPDAPAETERPTGTRKSNVTYSRYRYLVPPALVTAFPNETPITCDAQAPLPPAPSTFLLTSLSRAPGIAKGTTVSYLWDCMEQIRLTNPEARIVFLMDKEKPWDISSKAKEKFDIIVCDTPHPMPAKTIGQDMRFHMIAPLMKLLDLENIWHIEYDNMIYSDFTDHTLTASRLFKEVACVPVGSDHPAGYTMTGGIMFFKDYLAAETLGFYSWDKILHRDNKGYNKLNNDMRDLGSIQQEQGTEFLASLPILPYGKFSRYAKSFHSLFDPASYGQFVDGIGRASAPNQHRQKGFSQSTHFIGEGFASGRLQLSWKQDDRNLWFPQVYDTKTKKLYHLNNLHVYTKHLSEFSSNQTSMPKMPNVVSVNRGSTIRDWHLHGIWDE